MTDTPTPGEVQMNFHCIHCSGRFSNQTNLDRHLSRKHGHLLDDPTPDDPEGRDDGKITPAEAESMGLVTIPTPPVETLRTPRGVGRYPKVRDLYQDTRDKLYRLLADTQPDSMTRSQVTMMNDLQSRMEALITLNKTEPAPSVSWLNSKDKS